MDYKCFYLVFNFIDRECKNCALRVSRHFMAGGFLFTGNTLIFACLSKNLNPVVLLTTGFVFSLGGICCPWVESAVCQSVIYASKMRIRSYFSKDMSKYERRCVRLLRPLTYAGGSNFYVFDNSTFLSFLLFVYDKVVLVSLLTC